MASDDGLQKHRGRKEDPFNCKSSTAGQQLEAWNVHYIVHYIIYKKSVLKY